jgi:hypothetical protein
MRNPERRLVEDNIIGFHQRGHQIAVANVATQQANGTTGSRVYQVLWPATGHIVESYDLRAAFIAKQINDMRAYKSCSAGYQNAFAFEISQEALLFASSSRTRLGRKLEC